MFPSSSLYCMKNAMNPLIVTFAPLLLNPLTYRRLIDQISVPYGNSKGIEEAYMIDKFHIFAVNFHLFCRH